MRHKQVFTTGEAAEITGLSQQTIIRSVDNGLIEGTFRVPGSKFRRIPRESLIKYMRKNGIPMAQFEDAHIRVLVVDDDPQITELFADALKADGRFEIATASTGYEAGVQTPNFKPDILILDYMLPDINGDVVCATIRKNPALAHIKILLISGMVDPAEVDHLLKAGADHFIKKPFNIEAVIAKIVQLVRH